MKKAISVLFGAILLMTLFASPVLANPPWYDGPGGPDAKHIQTTPWEPHHRSIATDGLIDPTGGSASGFIVFLCESQEGFEYSVNVKGLAAGNYEVRGIPLQNEPEWDEILGFPNVALATSSDWGAYAYKVIDTIAVSSEGEVEGVVSSLPPGGYLWQIDVVDLSSGTVVLTTIPSGPPIPFTPWWPSPTPGDHVGFGVYP